MHQRRGGGGGRKRRGRRRREVGTFEEGWSPLNKTEEKKELQPVCVCVCVCMRGGKRALNKKKKGKAYENSETQP